MTSDLLMLIMDEKTTSMLTHALSCGSPTPTQLHCVIVVVVLEEMSNCEVRSCLEVT